VDNVENYTDWSIGTIIRLKDRDNYGYRVTLIYADGSKLVQQKSGFNTKKEAVDARYKTISELVGGTYVVESRLRLDSFLNDWLQNDIEGRVGSNETYATYSNIVRNHINPILGKKKLVEIDRGDIQHLYKSVMDYSLSCARLVKTVMNVSLKYAVQKRYLSENPAEGIKLPKNVSGQAYHTRNIDSNKTLTLEQIESLLEASKGSRIYMQVLFNVLMGLRRGEINGVKYSDVDYKNHTLTIERQLGIAKGSDKAKLPPKTYTKQEIRPKTESSCRVLPIPDVVFDAILEQRKIYESNRNRRKRGKYVFQDLDYICCSSYGRPRSKNYHWKHYKALLQKANLPDIRWHDLRSTYCTLLLKNGFSPKAVSKLMGHAKEIITVDVYGDNKNIMDEEIPELEAYMEEVMPKEKEPKDDIPLDGMVDLSEYL